LVVGTLRLIRSLVLNLEVSTADSKVDSPNMLSKNGTLIDTDFDSTQREFASFALRARKGAVRPPLKAYIDKL